MSFRSCSRCSVAGEAQLHSTTKRSSTKTGDLRVLAVGSCRGANKYGNYPKIVMEPHVGMLELVFFGQNTEISVFG
jgi:hypothetical protein